MLAVIAPEPAPWLAPLLAAHEGPAWVFAPWDLSGLQRFAPASLRAKLSRFTMTTARADVRVRSIPGWPLAIAASRAYERGRTDRQLAARFAFREVIDGLAARWLPDSVTAVVAPSGAARASFARALARAPRATRTIIQDTPILTALHADLDRAARTHPEAVFLRRFRAPHAVVTRQRAEWALATELRPRGAFARDALIEHGCPESVVRSCESPSAQPREKRPLPERPTVLLAGFAAARNGTYEALAMLDAIPECTLLLRAGEGAEPRALIEHPRARAVSERERATLEGVDLVIAPSWCESNPPEISQAIAKDVPVIATERARGWSRVDVTIESPEALVDAVRSLRR